LPQLIRHAAHCASRRLRVSFLSLCVPPECGSAWVAAIFGVVAIEAQRTANSRIAGQCHLTLDSLARKYRAQEGFRRMRARLCACLVAAAVALPAGGCVTVPSLDGNSIAVSDVVERVKCDLADALPDPYKYPWMANWVAKVDLTLIVNEQAGLTPTVSFIDLRPNAVVPGVGNIAQSFFFGAGAGATTQAVRTDSMSFSLSLVELRYKRQQERCVFYAGLGLDGDLGLKEWIASALEPVDRGVLTVGYHPRLMATRGAKAGERPPPPPPGNDPPLDSMSHQIQFIVGLSGSLSPNFTLVKFRGPAQTGSLAAASRVRTHTLAVVMASPRNNKTNTNEFATEAFKLQMQQLIQTPARP